jgi:two-component system, chemotaxis family, chemotaxis protein CheY
MNLKAQLAELKKDDSTLTLIERADFSCQVAKQLEKAGDYNTAWEALSTFWPDRDEPPKLEGLDDLRHAEVLLRSGALAGWRGSAEQAEGDQETAKNLISQSLELFEQLKQPVKIAEARGELGLCYWREGSYDEARIQLADALRLLGDKDSELRAVLLIRAAVVEVDTQQFDQALRFYSEALPLVEKTEDHALKGSFHIGYGILLMRLATPENREDYMDRALIEYAAASFHFEQAGNDRYLARVENNLGFLYFTIGQEKDAHKHLDRARYLFVQLKDIGTVAQVDDTRARTLIAEGHVAEAERIVRAAVRTLQRGGEQGVLADALTTHGTALARLGNTERAAETFEQAIQVAETAGDLEAASRTRLSIIEELGAKLPVKELIGNYRSAIDVLRSSQDPMIGKRSMACSAKLLDVIERMEPEQGPPATTWEGFSLRQHVRTGERAVIERALRDAGGSVTRASRLLGFKHHQSLISLITTRHRDLLPSRSTVRKRRRHIFSKAKKRKKRVERRVDNSHRSQVSVLHVEDHPMVARVIGEMLEAANYRVELCTDGKAALAKLTGDDHYDVLVIDNELPGLKGLELVRTTKKMTHRRRMPIIMLSGDDIEKQAWGAGADEFLRKPEGVERIAATVERLLAANDHT